MSFLRGNTRRLLDGGADAEPPISAEGRDVIVIGGGDTGTDCVGTAIRQGAKSVRQLELLARPPMQRAADNPWPEWPKVYKMDYGQEEAAALWGEDPRRYATTTRRFIGRNEHVTGMEIADVTWAPGPDGRIALREVPGTNQVIPADLVLLALGFTGPEPALPKAFDCELDPRGNVRAGAGPDDLRARACSPRATACAASRWSCGRSRRAGGGRGGRRVPGAPAARSRTAAEPRSGGVRSRRRRDRRATAGSAGRTPSPSRMASRLLAVPCAARPPGPAREARQPSPA